MTDLSKLRSYDLIDFQIELLAVYSKLGLANLPANKLLNERIYQMKLQQISEKDQLRLYTMIEEQIRDYLFNCSISTLNRKLR